MEDRPRPITIDPAQQALFALPEPDPSTGRGYRAPVAAGAARITYRQLDYWARTGLVEPSLRTAAGSGSVRLYTLRDILVLQVGDVLAITDYFVIASASTTMLVVMRSMYGSCWPLLSTCQ